MLVVEILTAHRLVADPSALDQVSWDETAIVMRIAEDEALVIGAEPPPLADPYAIVESETGFVGTWMTRSALKGWFERQAEWALPDSDAFFSQGMAAGLPVKVWVQGNRALLVTRTSLRHDLEARF